MSCISLKSYPELNAQGNSLSFAMNQPTDKSLLFLIVKCINSTYIIAIDLHLQVNLNWKLIF